MQALNNNANILSHQIVPVFYILFFLSQTTTFNILGAWLHTILLGPGIGKFIGRSSMAARIQFDNPLFWIRWSNGGRIT